MRYYRILLCLCAVRFCVANPRNTDDSRPPTALEIRTGLDQIKSSNPDSRREGANVLRRAACEQIGKSIVDALKGDPAFRELSTRRVAYEVLASCHGDKGSSVESALIQGMVDDDPGVITWSAIGLSSARHEVKNEGARLWAQQWNRWVEPGEDLSWELETTLRLGAIGQIAEKLLKASNDEARLTALWSFGFLASRTKGDFDSNTEHKQGIRDFIIESLDSSSAEVRRAAAEALSPAFGADTVVFESPTEYTLNPLLEETLQRLSQNSPDPLLRDRASKTLRDLREHLDRIAQKILRERQRQSGREEE